MSDQDVTDSPTPWVAEHINRYLSTDGADGHEWGGVPTLLLTTKGRKSGVLRRSALIYGRDGDRILIVASKGGSPTPPAWYLNLSSNPEVEVQIGADKFDARARTASAAEKPALWQAMAEIWPAYNDYQAKTSREIPVIILERTEMR